MQESPEAWDRLVIEPSACLYDLGGGLSEPRSFARRDPPCPPSEAQRGVCASPHCTRHRSSSPEGGRRGPDVWGSLLIAGPACHAVRPTSSQPPPQPSQVQGATGLRDRGSPLLKAPGSGSRPLSRKTDAGTLPPRSRRQGSHRSAQGRRRQEAVPRTHTCALVSAWRCPPPGAERGPLLSQEPPAPPGMEPTKPSVLLTRPFPGTETLDDTR